MLAPEKGGTIKPGALLVKGAERVSVIQPSPRDPIYFSALMLWAYFVGPDSALSTSKDGRLPGFVRAALAGSPQLAGFAREALKSFDVEPPDVVPPPPGPGRRILSAFLRRWRSSRLAGRTP
jgi:hypothetical protein